MPNTTGARADDARILELFVGRHAFYDDAAVRRLTGVTQARLERAAAEGEIEPVRQAGSLAFAWEDVALLALERWTPRRIALTLARAGRGHALPFLNQVRTISVELPVYQIRLLHHLAVLRSEEGRSPLNVSDILERELDALASEEEPSEIDRHIAGFEAAARFPSFENRPQLVEDQCTYCGTTLGAGREVCAACSERHVPLPEDSPESARRSIDEHRES